MGQLVHRLNIGLTRQIKLIIPWKIDYTVVPNVCPLTITNLNLIVLRPWSLVEYLPALWSVTDNRPKNTMLKYYEKPLPVGGFVGSVINYWGCGPRNVETQSLIPLITT